MISAPTLAALMGLDAALSLATLVVCTAATPLTAPVFAALFAGGMALSPLALGAELLAMLAGAALVAVLVRRAFGQSWIEAQKERIDGLSVIALFFFAVALMDGVLHAIVDEPLKVLGLTVLSFAPFARPCGPDRARVRARSAWRRRLRWGSRPATATWD